MDVNVRTTVEHVRRVSEPRLAHRSPVVALKSVSELIGCLESLVVMPPSHFLPRPPRLFQLQETDAEQWADEAGPPTHLSSRAQLSPSGRAESGPEAQEAGHGGAHL